MHTTKTDVINALATHSSDDLIAILDASDVSLRGATTARDLAERIADAIWWNYSTPIGYVANRASLESIVVHVGRKLKVKDKLGAGDAWTQLQDLTEALAEKHGPVSLEDLDPKVRKRITRRWAPSIAYAATGTSSFGAMYAGKKFLDLVRGPVERILPLIPYVGPAFKFIKGGAGIAAAVGGPLGVALSVLAVNSALGANYKRLVPLLIGTGALGPAEDAFVVDIPPASPELEPEPAQV